MTWRFETFSLRSSSRNGDQFGRWGDTATRDSASRNQFWALRQAATHAGEPSSSAETRPTASGRHSGDKDELRGRHIPSTNREMLPEVVKRIFNYQAGQK